MREAENNTNYYFVSRVQKHFLRKIRKYYKQVFNLFTYNKLKDKNNFLKAIIKTIESMD